MGTALLKGNEQGDAREFEKSDGLRATSGNGDADSKRGLWNAIRRFFDEDGETSLRAQIEEAIDEHVDEQAAGDEPPAKGDLSPVELTMLRNLLHFSEHDADDVAIPRGEIIAVAADAELGRAGRAVRRARPFAPAGLPRHASTK
jgi:hypothetical protein